MIADSNELMREEPLKRTFTIALALHILLALLLTAISFLFDMGIFQSTTEEAPEFLQTAVRVDVVAMPKLTVQELKNMRPEAPASEAKDAAPEAKVAESSSETEFKSEKKVELSSLLSNLSSRKTEKAKKKKNKGSALDSKALSALAMEGNKVSKGQSLVGDALKENQGEFAEYVSGIPAQVRPHWKLPSYLIEKNLKARIRIYISGNGKILKTEIYESSGVDEFDRRALRALKATGILPPPSKNIRSRLASGQVVLGFPL